MIKSDNNLLPVLCQQQKLSLYTREAVFNAKASEDVCPKWVGTLGMSPILYVLRELVMRLESLKVMDSVLQANAYEREPYCSQPRIRFGKWLPSHSRPIIEIRFCGGGGMM